MSSRRNQLWITHRFGGGWATDFGPTYYGAPDQSGTMMLPFLVDAKNVIYEFDGGPHKCPGTSALNSASLGATSGVNGVYDYWRIGTTGTPSQRVVGHVDTRIFWSDLSGNTTVLKTGLTNNAVPNYSTFNDLLLIGSDSTTDVPMSWDQTTFQNLAGTPPRFSFSVPHFNKQFAAGNWAAGSRLYYSVTLAPDDWAGAGSGSIDINKNDGDYITGIVSWQNQLIIFKGPYKGSIFILTGSDSTTFALQPLISGIGAAWQNSIFKYGSDVGWFSPFGTAHSLQSTAAYGNYNQAYLSYPITQHIRDNVNSGNSRKWWAVNVPLRNYVLMTYPNTGQTNNDHCLLMDYRWMAHPNALGVQQGDLYPRWALWDAFGFSSLGLVVDTNNVPRIFAGAYDGVVYKLDQTIRTHKNTSIPMTVTTPFLTYGNELRFKTLERAAVGIQPKNNNNLTFGWQADNNTQQTQTISQGGSDTLG